MNTNKHRYVISTRPFSIALVRIFQTMKKRGATRRPTHLMHMHHRYTAWIGKREAIIVTHVVGLCFQMHLLDRTPERRGLSSPSPASIILNPTSPRPPPTSTTMTAFAPAPAPAPALSTPRLHTRGLLHIRHPGRRHPPHKPFR